MSACRSRFTQIAKGRGMGPFKAGASVLFLPGPARSRRIPAALKHEIYRPPRRRYRAGAQCPPRKLPTCDLLARRQSRAVPSVSERSLREPPHLPGPGLRPSAPPAAAAFRCTRALSQSRARPPPAAAVRLAPGRGRGTFALLLPARGRRRQRHRGHEL
ncbi:hypothetical protein NN561_010644 [Cricetulus griseus]